MYYSANTSEFFWLGRGCERGGHKYVLVKTDAFSKLAELVPLKDKEAGTVAKAIVDTWICRYPTP